MLKFNLESLFAFRNIIKKQAYLIKNGITPHTSKQIINNKIKKFSLADIENLCIAFNCTPNDLLDYTPPQNSKLPADHPLHSITKKPLADIKGLLETIPYDKAMKLINRIEDITKSPE